MVGKRKVVVFSGSAAAVVVATPFVGVGTASAVSFEVTNLSDSGAGSLRPAIEDANNVAGPDVITIQSGLSGTITLSSGHLSINDSVEIQGSSDVTISGGNASRIFYLYNSTATPIEVTISGFALEDGAASEGGAVKVADAHLSLSAVSIANNAADGDGGAIWIDGDDGWLEVDDSVIADNSAGAAGGGVFVGEVAEVSLRTSTVEANYAGDDGGGVYIRSTTDGFSLADSELAVNSAAQQGGGLFVETSDGDEMVVLRSTISGNVARDGGGIYINSPTDPLIIDQSTISDNTATFDGGGVFIYLGYYAEITSSTISGNEAGDQGGGVYLNETFYYDSGDGFYASPLRVAHSTITENYSGDGGGGIYIAEGWLELDHSIVSGNDSDGGYEDIDSAYYHSAYPYAPVYSTWSLVGDVRELYSSNDDVYDSNPMLDSLADNGGPTETHLLLPGSPASEAGDPAISGAPTTDQRGLTRIVGAIDIGAVEAQIVLEDDEFSTNEDTVLTVAVPGVLDNDQVDVPAVASVVATPTSGTLVLNADGSFTYTPNANFHGSDTFRYTVTEADVTALQAEPVSAEVTITVNPVNDPPVALPDTVTAMAGVNTPVTVVVNDSDSDGDPISIVGVTQGAKGNRRHRR